MTTDDGSNVTSSEIVPDISPKTGLLAISLSPHSALFLYSDYYYQLLNFIYYYDCQSSLPKPKLLKGSDSVFFISIFPVPRTVRDTKYMMKNIN